MLPIHFRGIKWKLTPIGFCPVVDPHGQRRAARDVRLSRGLTPRRSRGTLTLIVSARNRRSSMPQAMRLLPELTTENTPFWTGGARGELMIMHCEQCDHAIHPPELVCPICLSRTVAPRAAKGTGSIYSVTVN